MSNKFFRFEVKYPIDCSKISLIEQDLLAAGMRPDINVGRSGSYWVSSLYFDTFAFSDYYDKVGGLLQRMKIRARIYDRVLEENTSIINLELKEKYGMMVMKKRARLNRDQWQDLCQSNWSSLSVPRLGESEEDGIFRRILYEISSKGRRPQVFISYLRKPYTHERSSNMLRVTFDKEIEACQATVIPRDTHRMIRALPPTKAVMEVKYSRDLPPFMKFMIRKYDLKRDAISKYALGVESSYRFLALKK